MQRCYICIADYDFEAKRNVENIQNVPRAEFTQFTAFTNRRPCHMDPDLQRVMI